MVAKVDGVVAVDEKGLWIYADSAVTSESGAIGIPCCIRAQLRLVE